MTRPDHEARISRLETRMDEVAADAAAARHLAVRTARGRVDDQTAAGFARIAELITAQDDER